MTAPLPPKVAPLPASENDGTLAAAFTFSVPPVSDTDCAAVEPLSVSVPPVTVTVSTDTGQLAETLAPFWATSAPPVIEADACSVAAPPNRSVAPEASSNAPDCVPAPKRKSSPSSIATVPAFTKPRLTEFTTSVPAPVFRSVPSTCHEGEPER